MYDEILSNVAEIEKEMNAKLGDVENPLLLSVRSGAAISMPGMMDTVLNLGLNTKTVEGLSKKTNNPRFAWDSFRRFVNMFGEIVLDVEHSSFQKIMDELKKQKGVNLDTELKVEDLQELVKRFKENIKKKAQIDFPEDAKQQLQMSVEAVFRSWNCSRAVAYRKINDIRGLLGTAVTVMTMVFGNMGDSSGTGVAFSRDPNTGAKQVLGEVLFNAQGEDVVAGIRTPLPISKLQEVMPAVHKQFNDIIEKLEAHYKDMQDVEFTIQEEQFYMLQCRVGKRSAAAALQIAIDLVSEGKIDKKEALLRIDPNSLNQLLHPQIDSKAKTSAVLLGKGLGASPGAAVGELVFDAETAVKEYQKGKAVILARLETSPEDIEGMDAAKGILTARGGMTSHAAVVARGMGKTCVCGCSDIEDIDDEKGFLKMQGQTFKTGDVITINGTTGEVFSGAMPLKEPDVESGNFATIMQWSDEFRRLKVRANADVPRDAQQAMKFGAQGIGLCRTEHMFFKGPRIMAMREMILASDLEGRKKALAKLLVFQKDDFKGLFQTMEGRPVTIRFLDPPLHEFLPQQEEDIKALATEMKVTVEAVKSKVSELHEFNPMLGHRGCRLGIYYPEITEMQARAVFEAAMETNVIPEIMVPLVGFHNELINQQDVVVRVHAEVCKQYNKELKYLFGTMIEVPRGALTAGEIAQTAQFFSFGTNDLTQMGCGFSRDDSAKFIKYYCDKNIFEKDPF